jgi:predicted metal-dependent peptidase
MNRTRAATERRRLDAIDDGWTLLRSDPVLGWLGRSVRRTPGDRADGWAVVDTNGVVEVNVERDGAPEQWAWVFAHLLLHLALGHAEPPDQHPDPPRDAARCAAVLRLAEQVRVGTPPFEPPDAPAEDEEVLARRWRRHGPPAEFARCGTGGSRPCVVRGRPRPRRTRWDVLFARGLAEAAAAALGDGPVRRERAWDRALSWFVSSYPLLGAIAAGFTIVADPEIARSWHIRIAAVSADRGEIYVNPHAALTPDEWCFVLAHEMLHASLRHDHRADGRDPYLWNVACDYVINGWLVAMGVGSVPDGGLYDPALTGLSAESVYDTLTTDLRRARKLRTLGGRDVGDVLGDWLSEPDAVQRRGSRRSTAAAPWLDRAGTVDLDDFYRRALTQGLEYHRIARRGVLPAGLEEEIRALDQPPLPWDARLARWFDEHVRAAEPRRSYARASRRQSAVPDIPLPGRLTGEQVAARPTFGVVLDTSGSMDAPLLGKALGAIASYATARDVPAARVVFCDAVAYDAGYLPVEQIADRVRVRGRGGTVLQPGVTLLERAPDFPPDGPILVITDGACDIVGSGGSTRSWCPRARGCRSPRTARCSASGDGLTRPMASTIRRPGPRRPRRRGRGTPAARRAAPAGRRRAAGRRA